MGRIIYVTGNIIVNTPYFYPKEAGAGFGTPPDGAIVIEANNTYGGTRCLLIDDEHPQSLFDEYYAQGEFATAFLVTNYLAASYEECLNEYKRCIEDVCQIVMKAGDWDLSDRNILYKMAYLNVMTVLDAFICHVVLKRMVSDENLFKDAAYALAPETKKNVWNKYIDEQNYGSWEQDAIKFIQRTSFLNVDKVDDLLKKMKLSRVVYDRRLMKNYFEIRHVLIHRNGIRRDDQEIEITYELLSELIKSSHSLVCGIRSSIYKANEIECIDKLKVIEKEAALCGERSVFEIEELQQWLYVIREELSVKPVLPLLQ